MYMKKCKRYMYFSSDQALTFKTHLQQKWLGVRAPSPRSTEL